MEQTALEWFINGLLVSNYITKDSKIMNQFIEQAKALEKQQIINAFIDGDFMSTGMDKDAEIYYNETYNK